MQQTEGDFVILSNRSEDGLEVVDWDKICFVVGLDTRPTDASIRLHECANSDDCLEIIIDHNSTHKLKTFNCICKKVS